MTLYIYNQNLELVGMGDKRRMEAGSIIDIYIGMGYIISASQMF